MRIVVIGAGALGTLYGAGFAKAGHDVTLIHHRRDYCQQVNESGVTVKGDLRADTPFNIDIPIHINADGMDAADMVLVLVKSHMTHTALQTNMDCIGRNTWVVSLQGGFRIFENLLDMVDRSRTIVGNASQGAIMEEPGKVLHTHNGTGTLGGAKPTIREQMVDVFNSAGFAVEAVDDPIAHIWKSQIASLAVKPLTALTRLPKGEMLNVDDLDQFAMDLVEEGLAVADAENIQLPDAQSPRMIIDRHRSSSHKPSMLQDVEMRRKTEIDEITGVIVELAERHDIGVPNNRIVLQLIHGLERSFEPSDPA